jgi:hypothetical protein
MAQNRQADSCRVALKYKPIYTELMYVLSIKVPLYVVVLITIYYKNLFCRMTTHNTDVPANKFSAMHIPYIDMI